MGLQLVYRSINIASYQQTDGDNFLYIVSMARLAQSSPLVTPHFPSPLSLISSHVVLLLEIGTGTCTDTFNKVLVTKVFFSVAHKRINA